MIKSKDETAVLPGAPGRQSSWQPPAPLTAEELVAFETEIARTFNAGQIRAPIHLYYGNEAQMIQIFRDVKPEDWVFCSWRSHYQCLLKAVPRQEVKA